MANDSIIRQLINKYNHFLDPTSVKKYLLDKGWVFVGTLKNGVSIFQDSEYEFCQVFVVPPLELEEWTECLTDVIERLHRRTGIDRELILIDLLQSKGHFQGSIRIQTHTNDQHLDWELVEE